jgi:hypothetical protein
MICRNARCEAPGERRSGTRTRAGNPDRAQPVVRGTDAASLQRCIAQDAGDRQDQGGLIFLSIMSSRVAVIKAPPKKAALGAMLRRAPVVVKVRPRMIFAGPPIGVVFACHSSLAGGTR